MRLIGVAQAAEMPLAHAQQRSSLHAAQLLRLMQPTCIDHPGHSDLRQHAIPPVKTGQLVCSQTRTYLVSPTHSYSRSPFAPSPAACVAQASLARVSAIVA